MIRTTLALIHPSTNVNAQASERVNVLLYIPVCYCWYCYCRYYLSFKSNIQGGNEKWRRSIAGLHLCAIETCVCVCVCMSDFGWNKTDVNLNGHDMNCKICLLLMDETITISAVRHKESLQWHNFRPANNAADQHVLVAMTVVLLLLMLQVVLEVVAIVVVVGDDDDVLCCYYFSSIQNNKSKKMYEFSLKQKYHDNENH